jgi:hypothetical protein
MLRAFHRPDRSIIGGAYPASHPLEVFLKSLLASWGPAKIRPPHNPMPNYSFANQRTVIGQK